MDAGRAQGTTDRAGPIGTGAELRAAGDGEWLGRERELRALAGRLDGLRLRALVVRPGADPVARCRAVARAVGTRPAVIAYALRARPRLRRWVLTGKEAWR